MNEANQSFGLVSPLDLKTWSVLEKHAHQSSILGCEDSNIADTSCEMETNEGGATSSLPFLEDAADENLSTEQVSDGDMTSEELCDNSLTSIVAAEDEDNFIILDSVTASDEETSDVEDGKLALSETAEFPAERDEAREVKTVQRETEGETPEPAQPTHPTEEEIENPTCPLTEVAEVKNVQLMPLYYHLPAALIVPLIKLGDSNYKPLSAEDIQLPAPTMPSASLLTAVELFYRFENEERPRDSDGWELDPHGLYQYYVEKEAAIKKKEEEISAGIRKRSAPPSPVSPDRSSSMTPPINRHSRSRSSSPTPSRSRSRSRSTSRGGRYSRSRTSSESRSRSRSPWGSRSSSGSRSRSRSKSPPGYKKRSRSHSRSPEPRRLKPWLYMKSLSPPRPSFGQKKNVNAVSNLPSLVRGSDINKRLDENNKGHQMLRKMGWCGTGLGVNEQGILEPISGGEVRDKVGLYRGLGLNLSNRDQNFPMSRAQLFMKRSKLQKSRQW